MRRLASVGDGDQFVARRVQLSSALAFWRALVRGDARQRGVLVFEACWTARLRSARFKRRDHEHFSRHAIARDTLTPRLMLVARLLVNEFGDSHGSERLFVMRSYRRSKWNHNSILLV